MKVPVDLSKESSNLKLERRETEKYSRSNKRHIRQPVFRIKKFRIKKISIKMHGVSHAETTQTQKNSLKNSITTKIFQLPDF